MNDRRYDDVGNSASKIGNGFSIFYLIMTIYFIINSFLYAVVINSPIAFTILFALINILLCVFMFLGRNSKITVVISLLLVPLQFFVLIFNYGSFYVFIPLFLVSLFMFFACRATETLKTVLGTVYLLLYVVGVVVFVLMNNFFGTALNQVVLTSNMPADSYVMEIYSQQKIDEVNKNSISPDGKLKYYIIDTDGSSGKVELWVKPNEKDKNFVLFSFKQKGCNKLVGYLFKRGDAALPTVKWTGNNKLTYTFPGEKEKNTVISPEDIEKDYFEFMVN